MQDGSTPTWLQKPSRQAASTRAPLCCSSLVTLTVSSHCPMALLMRCARSHWMRLTNSPGSLKYCLAAAAAAARVEAATAATKGGAIRVQYVLCWTGLQHQSWRLQWWIGLVLLRHILPNC
jgi:hypothetical protein